MGSATAVVNQREISRNIHVLVRFGQTNPICSTASAPHDDRRRPWAELIGQRRPAGGRMEESTARAIETVRPASPLHDDVFAGSGGMAIPIMPTPLIPIPIRRIGERERRI